MAVIEREVEFAPGAEFVRQYRPALESFTWELPAGLIDPHEDAVACCRRELMEGETGFAARAVNRIAAYAVFA